MEAKFRVFEHLTVPKSELYRAVIAVFVEAKSSFRLHLRPAELLDPITSRYGATDIDEIESALQKLCEWGNIESAPDTADAATVEEFVRQRFLYQLSKEGEAAEASIKHFEAVLASTAQLRTAALTDVRTLLMQIVEFTADSDPDQAKVHLTLRNLWTRFGELTSEAQSFMSSLQRTIDLRGRDLAHLVAYKQRLIDYLDRFIMQLRVVGSDIAEQLRRLDPPAVRPLLYLAAQREVADMLEATDKDRTEAVQQWVQRWDGLISWFLGSGEAPPLIDTLRARARAAIPALLAAIASINESRLTRTDRVTDLRTLARWFAEADTDADAHRLWRAAFGLAPARHLTVDQRTLEEWETQPVSSRTSWADAPPVNVSPRFRATGRSERAPAVPTMLDCSKARALLAKEAREEAEQAAAARERLANLGRLRLSQVPHLNRVEFGLFLDLLGQVLAHRTPEAQRIQVDSTDGTLRITLEPICDGSVATIHTTDGDLTGPDHFLAIEDALHAPGPPPEDPMASPAPERRHTRRSKHVSTPAE